MVRPWGSAFVDRVLPPFAAAYLVGVVAAVSVFLGVLALALGLAAGRMAETWSGELASVATLQVYASADSVEPQAIAALDVLRSTPGVQSVRIIEAAEQHAMLEPWFGSGLALDALPLPLLIEVEADRDLLDKPALVERLAGEAPGAAFDDHTAWRAPLIETAERLQLVAFTALGLLTALLAMSVWLAASGTRMTHLSAISILRQVGARDSYIVRVFTRKFSRNAAIGSLTGVVGALAILMILTKVGTEGYSLAAVAPKGSDWLALALLLPACVALSWIVTALAVRRGLSAEL